MIIPILMIGIPLLIIVGWVIFRNPVNESEMADPQCGPSRKQITARPAQASRPKFMYRTDYASQSNRWRGLEIHLAKKIKKEAKK